MMFRLALVLLLAAPSLAQTAESYRQRAIELSRKKSWDEAIANYQQAIALNPNDASTHYNFALALKYKGDSQQAVQEFQAALRLKPKWSDAHYGLGATWYDLQDFTAALKELQTAVKLEPANAAVHRFLARIYAQQNDTSDAEHELLRALQLKPSAEMYFELGLVRVRAKGRVTPGESWPERPPSIVIPLTTVHVYVAGPLMLPAASRASTRTVCSPGWLPS